jgi:O-acetyl-ADP-ribose deacetylase (regulator of RNase III)
MRLHLVDSNPQVAAALSAAFQPFGEVEVLHGDLLSVARGAVVAPSNGAGFAGCGFDRACMDYFGWQVGETVRRFLARRPEARLAIGETVVVRTGDERIPHLIVASTLLFPSFSYAAPITRAMRAVLNVMSGEPEIGEDVYCPGLGTGAACVPPRAAAEQMARAYAEWRDAAARLNQLESA